MPPYAQVLDRYLFDREFRLLTLDAIERIEISFRTQWAFHMSSKYGAHGYLINDKSIRKNEGHFNQCIRDLTSEFSRSDEVFIKHYRNNYDEDLPPAWVSCEVMSLGLLSRFYSNLRAYPVRRVITATWASRLDALMGRYDIDASLMCKPDPIHSLFGITYISGR